MHKKVSKFLLFVFFCVAVLCPSSQADNLGGANHAQKRVIMSNLSSMSMSFTENQGQWDEKVLFRSDARGAIMWFTKDGAYYQFTRWIPADEGSSDKPIDSQLDRLDREPGRYESIMVKASFVGANPNPQLVGEELLDGKCNYFIGNDPAKWRRNVPNYRSVIYKDVYAGIDLKYYGDGNQMEYDFVVSPGADPSQIQVQYEGVKSLYVDESGELVIETRWGSVVEHKPAVYELQGNLRTSIDCEYALLGANTFGFNLNSDYDSRFALVIDPKISYSTYFGGTQGEATGKGGIVLDDQGCIYMLGSTRSAVDDNFPITPGVYDDTHNGEEDAFVAKLCGAGDTFTNLVYCTYIGGSQLDSPGGGIAIDSDGNAYVAGLTYSDDFPMVNPFDDTWGYPYDGWVAKLSPVGDSLLYSTYLGGRCYDVAHGIAVNSSGNTFVTGETASDDFPIVNCSIDTFCVNGDFEAFISKFSPDGSTLEYSCYLGGSTHDAGNDISIDEDGNAFVTGNTGSEDFPITSDAYDTSYNGGGDVFVAKISSSVGSLLYSTYLGGDSTDNPGAIVVDVSGSAYVAGATSSIDFPTTDGAYDTSHNGNKDIFVTKLPPTGSSLVYSTFLGGYSAEDHLDLGIDGMGNAYVSGLAYSSDFPCTCGFSEAGNRFLTKLSATGANLVFSTRLGFDLVNTTGVHVTADGDIYIITDTNRPDLPTVNSYDSSYNGNYDVYIMKITPCPEGIDCGDCNEDGVTDIADVIWLVNYLFIGGSPPPPCTGNVTCDCMIDVADLVHLINYLFISGPPPCCCSE